MLAFILSPQSFLLIPLTFFIGSIGALVLHKNDTVVNWWNAIFSIGASVWGFIFATVSIWSGNELFFSTGATPFPLLKLTFHIDQLAAFFILIFSLVSVFCSIYGLGYLTHYYKKYDVGVFSFFYQFFVGSLFIVATAAQAVFFLFAWEIMSLASYFMVVYDRHDRENVKAGLLYLIMTYVGTAFIILAFLLMYKYTGTFDFHDIKEGIHLIPPSIKDFIFIFAVIGFGTKAGIIPFHIWLPEAHPAAPTQVSAIMSGVMIKTGIYMLIRLFLDIMQPIPVWWGIVILSIGIISALLGVLYALTEHDIKRLLAFHSIENIGIILLGIGSAMIFYSLDMPQLALLGLIAGLFHTINHAIFKSLLFLGAGAVINQMHTRNIEEYGGLIKYMPQTAMFFLIGSMAISALPPFNGFFSEWLTYQTLFAGILHLDAALRGIFIIAVGSLALTGGLALACFVKAFGAIFLARPRSHEVQFAKEASLSMRIGMGSLALLSILFGIFSTSVVTVIEKIAQSFSLFEKSVSPLTPSSQYGLVMNAPSATVSAPAMVISFFMLFLVVSFVITHLIYKKQKVSIGKTWNCGTDVTPRMEITSTSFARSIITIFKGVLKPSLQHTVEYHDSESRFLQKSHLVTLRMGDVYLTYFYRPLFKIVNLLSLRVRIIQNGNINIYISYIFAALIISLFYIL